MSSIDLELVKKGEIFEANNGDLIFICCICNEASLGMKEVESHLKTHIEIVITEPHLTIDYTFNASEGFNDVFLNIKEETGPLLAEPLSPFSDIDNDNKFFERESVDTNTSNESSDFKEDKSDVVPRLAPDKKSIIKKKRGRQMIQDFCLTKCDQYKCDICDRVFAQKSFLRRHILYHSDKKRHKCYICGHKFVESGNLKVHILRHNKIKPYNCKECDKNFSTSTELKSHTRSHRGEKNFMCTMCGKLYATSGIRAVHVRRVHMKDRRHKCDFIGCNESFYMANQLTIHRRFHTGERPMNCKFCNKTFANPKVLRNHLLLHNPEKTFQCKFCPSKFAQSSGRRGHEKRVHGAFGTPWNNSMVRNQLEVLH